jgi:hypothetical protein
MSNYVDFHKQPAPPKKELPDHEVFNNALMRAQAAGEKPSAELFAKIDSEYKKKKEKKAAVKSAGIGTTVGILGGLASGRGDDKLRSAGRGAIKGMGFDVGAGLGGALGGALGLATLNPALGVAGVFGGGLGGGMLGQSLASSAIGPYETEEDKFERMLAAREAAQLKLKNKEKSAMSLYSFGAKLANVTGMTFDPDHPNVKRLKARHPDNWQQIMAQSQGLSDAAQAKAIKKAQSSCSPCAMPNGPTNKKPYNSVSPAVTDASQKSEEIGKPPVTETEHSEAKAKQPEEGAKSAFAFGMKVAAGFAGLPNVPYSPQSSLMYPNYELAVDEMRANPFHPMWNNAPDMKATEGRMAVTAGPLAAKRQRLDKLHNEIQVDKARASAQKPSIMNPGPRNMLDTVVDAWAAAPPAIANKITDTGKSMASYGGPRNLLDTAVDGYMTGFNALTSAPGKALASAQKLWNEGGNDGGRGYQGPPGSTPQVSGKVGPKPTAPAATGAGAGTGAAGGGVMDYLTNPYVLGGGVGALGLGGLLYYLNNQPKKKKRDEGDE